MAIDGVGAGPSAANSSVQVARQEGEVEPPQKAEERSTQNETGLASDVPAVRLSSATLATNIISPSGFGIVVQGEDNTTIATTIASVSEKVEERVRNSLTNNVVTESEAGTNDGSADREIPSPGRIVDTTV